MEDNIINEKIIICSGNNNKSIGSYIDLISNKIISNKKVCIQAFGNNMNKLITIVEILKRANDKIKVKYNIGKEKDIEYIQSVIISDNDNISGIKDLIGKKKENKRKIYSPNLNKMDMETKNKEQDKNQNSEIDKDIICINNINNIFNFK